MKKDSGPEKRAVGEPSAPRLVSACGPTHHHACDCREAYFAQVEKGIQSFTAMCDAACERRDCYSFVSRGLTCPDCPKQWAEELDAHIQSANVKRSDGATNQSTKESKEI